MINLLAVQRFSKTKTTSVSRLRSYAQRVGWRSWRWRRRQRSDRWPIVAPLISAARLKTSSLGSNKKHHAVLERNEVRKQPLVSGQAIPGMHSVTPSSFKLFDWLFWIFCFLFGFDPWMHGKAILFHIEVVLHRTPICVCPPPGGSCWIRIIHVGQSEFPTNSKSFWKSHADLSEGGQWSFDPKGGPWANNLLKIGVFPLKLPENCMILKKSWGQGGPGPLDPLLSHLCLFHFPSKNINRNHKG